MPNDGINTRAKCPYFKKIKGKGIVCEGATEDSILLLMFHEPEMRDAWVRCRCECFDYAEHCPIARMLEKMYQESQTIEETK